MSTLAQVSENEDCVESPCAEIERIIRPGKKDLGGFHVRRALPMPMQRKVGPWVFFDHAGPATFQPGQGLDVRPHPHINLATVTYLFAGQFLHRDSLGNEQLIGPGEINLMVAGRGIVHSERTPGALKANGSSLHALQLWLALPEADEETAPDFYHHPAEAMPELDLDGVKVRILMGSAYGAQSPVKTFARTLYLEANLPGGHSLSLPEEEERALYVVDGAVTINGQELGQFDFAVLSPGPATIATQADSRVALIGGETLSERHIAWNFVSSTRERIEQAKQDWRAGRFPKVPGDEEEFIPLPE